MCVGSCDREKSKKPSKPVLYPEEKFLYPEEKLQEVNENLLSENSDCKADVVAQRKTLNRSQVHGTVLPYPGFSADSDAKALNNAKVDCEIDKKAIIKILGDRTSEQLKEVAKKYNELYNKSLESELKSELSGEFETICVGRLYTQWEYYAYTIRNAKKGPNTDERAIIDVLCTRTNNEIKNIEDTYMVMYERNMKSDLMDMVEGDFKVLIEALLRADRDEKVADVPIAYSDAEEIYRARRKRKQIFQETCFRFLTCRSYSHLREVFAQYKLLSNVDIAEDIEAEVSGHVKLGMLTIVRFVKDPLAYYSYVLYKSLKGKDTDDDALIRCVLSRCEIDLVEIKKKFKDTYGQSLDKMIKNDTRGDYGKMLQLIIRRTRKRLITSPNDLIDASFKDRRSFFKELIENRPDSDRGVDWGSIQKQSIENVDRPDVIVEKDRRFFGGTLREKGSMHEKVSIHDGYHTDGEIPTHGHELLKLGEWSPLGRASEPAKIPLAKISPRRSLLVPKKKRKSMAQRQSDRGRTKAKNLLEVKRA